MESSEQAMPGKTQPISPAVARLVDLANLAAVCDLTPALVTSCAEAARVALSSMSHPAPPPLTQAELHYQDKVTLIQLLWTMPDRMVLSSYGNDLDATEYGAYAIAIGAVRFLSKRYRVIGRAQQGSGADFLMVAEGEPEENYVKLEVSGTRSEQQEVRRIKEKTKQVKSGIAVVVNFEKPRVLAREEIR